MTLNVDFWMLLLGAIVAGVTYFFTRRPPGPTPLPSDGGGGLLDELLRRLRGQSATGASPAPPAANEIVRGPTPAIEVRIVDGRSPPPPVVPGA